jgi:hypothetical protein
MNRNLAAAVVAGLVAFPSTHAIAQQTSGNAKPVDKPPVAQGWIDLATFSSPGMPGGMGAMMMGGTGGSGAGQGGNPLSALMGGKNDGNHFGNTQAGGSGRYMDVTLRTLRNPALTEALQTVPSNSQLAPTLQLKVLPESRPVAESTDESVQVAPEPPRGKFKLYWGCGPTIRAGQPKVFDLATGNLGELGEMFRGRRATQRGTHAAPGRPVWPNLADKRLLPEGATLAGSHAFIGEGVPESFKSHCRPRKTSCRRLRCSKRQRTA